MPETVKIVKVATVRKQEIWLFFLFWAIQGVSTQNIVLLEQSDLIGGIETVEKAFAKLRVPIPWHFIILLVCALPFYPQVELKKRQEKLKEVMKSEMVKTASEMGFGRKVIKHVVKRFVNFTNVF